MRRLSHRIIKNSVTSAKQGFMMLMIVMMIAMIMMIVMMLN